MELRVGVDAELSELRSAMARFLFDNWLMILTIAVVAGGYLFLRTPGDNLASTAEFDAVVTAGTPTLLEFYTNT